MQAGKRQALPARHELKYFVNPAELDVLRKRLSPVLRLDPHCKSGPYMIRSLYFDDAFDAALRDKENGVMHRDKYRIRIYNSADDEIFLERKRKAGDLIQKSSVRITRRLCEKLIEGDPRGLQAAPNPLIQEMFLMMRTRLLRPKVIVDYAREAYVHPVEDVRVTFDTNLRTGLSSLEMFDPDIPTVCPHDRNVEILEVKFNAYLPDFVSALLAGLSAERSAISKYVLARRFEHAI
jgi:hypothetical protein